MTIELLAWLSAALASNTDAKEHMYIHDDDDDDDDE